MAGHRGTRRAVVGLLLLALTQGVLAAVGSSPSGAATAADPCRRPAGGFVPTSAAIPAINRTVKVIQVPRKSNGQVGAGPISEEGKWLMAMDPQTKPASRRGSVLLSGHTYPDGSALGNAMLRNLSEGDELTLTGRNGQRACYRIHERAQYPKDQVPRKKAFRYWGPEQLVIVACSGKRTSPGNWSHRTLWYAVPILPEKPAPTPTPEPPSEGGGLGGLLGGLLGGS